MVVEGAFASSIGEKKSYVQSVVERNAFKLCLQCSSVVRFEYVGPERVERGVPAPVEMKKEMSERWWGKKVKERENA